MSEAFGEEERLSSSLMELTTSQDKPPTELKVGDKVKRVGVMSMAAYVIQTIEPDGYYTISPHNNPEKITSIHEASYFVSPLIRSFLPP